MEISYKYKIIVSIILLLWISAIPLLFLSESQEETLVDELKANPSGYTGDLNQGTAYDTRTLATSDTDEYTLEIGGGALSTGWFYCFYMDNLGSYDYDLCIQDDGVDYQCSGRSSGIDDWVLWYLSASGSVWSAEVYYLAGSSDNYGYEFPNTYTDTLPINGESYSFSGKASVLQVDLESGKTYDFKVSSAAGCRFQVFGPEGKYSSSSGTPLMNMYCSDNSETSDTITVSTTGKYAILMIEDSSSGESLNIWFNEQDSTPPSIGTVSGEEDPIMEDDDQTLSCTVSDPGSGLDWARIFYRTNAQSWSSSRYATISGDAATIQDTAYSYGQTVSYYVGAKDNSDNYNYRGISGETTSEATAQSNAFTFDVDEDTDPTIGIVSGEVDPIDTDTDQTLDCSVSDSGGSGLDWARFFYKTDSQSWSSSRYATISAGTATIPNSAYSYGQTVSYYVGAKDNANNYNYRHSGGTTTSEATAQSNAFTFDVDEDTEPTIGTVSGEDDPIPEDQDQTLDCAVSDSGGSGLDWARIFYRINAQSWSSSRYVTISAGTGTISSSAYTDGDTIYYYVGAKDNADNYNYRHSSGTTTSEATAQSNAFSFTVEAGTGGDTDPPIITVNKPDAYDDIADEAPYFDLSIDEDNLHQSWYRINFTSTKYFFTGLNGYINQTGWSSFGLGIITIRFYANDTGSYEGYADIIINKVAAEESDDDDDDDDENTPERTEQEIFESNIRILAAVVAITTGIIGLIIKIKKK